MSIVKSIFITSMLTATLVFSALKADDALPPVAGEVRKVTPDSGKITIKHEPIPNLDMPGMTMVFRAGEDTDLSQYQKGDKVSFTVVEKDGKMYLISIEKSE